MEKKLQADGLYQELMGKLWELRVHAEPFGYAHTDRNPSCYVSGPMTGLCDFNVRSFHQATELLRNAGWEVFSPHEHDEEIGVELEGYPTGDIPTLQEMSDFDLSTSLAWDIERICNVDVVFVLPGWEYSEGAEVEVCVAHKLGRPVYTLLHQRKIEPEQVGSSQEVSLASAQSASGESDCAGSDSPTLAEYVATNVSRHPNSARFHELVEEIGELHDRKQKDYGSDQDPFHNVRSTENWGIPAWVGALLRLNDKIVRLQNLARKGSLANEAAEDSMRDIAVYALIALVLYEQESQHDE